MFERLQRAIGASLGKAHRLSLNPRLVALSAVAAVVLAVGLFVAALDVGSHHLRVAAGDPIGRRFQLAQTLSLEAASRDLVLELVETAGSREALDQVERGELDAALVQGGLRIGTETREVGALVLEPLHLLVRADIGAKSIHALRGRRVNLSVRGSGTYVLARQVLRQAGLHGARGIAPTYFTYEELESMPAQELPDAIFIVSSVPAPVATYLTREQGFELLPIPFADALALSHPGWRNASIPAYAYAGDPPAPPDRVETVGTRLLVVAHKSASRSAVRRLVESLASERFLRAAELPRIDEENLLRSPEIPLHEGAVDYLERNQQVLTHELIDNLESLRSFFVSLAVAIFLLWRWWRARQLRGFDVYIAEVSKLEREIQDLELRAELDVPQLLRMRQRLGSIKASGLDQYAEGRMGSTELLSSFLLQISDVRMHLDALLLHARERLEKKARRTGPAPDEDAILEELWTGAVAGLDESVE